MMEDLSLHVLDLAENAVSAGAGRIEIAINENEARDLLTIRVADDGRGMTAAELERALDPFFTTKRKRTGLGLALLAQTAGLCGGDVAVTSAPGRGTRVLARFRFGHIDRPPLTKMAETVMMLVFGHPEIDLRYRHRRNGRAFSFRSLDLIARTGPAWAPETIRAVRADLARGLKKIGAR
jgi:Histidine kinase-, DNA gyrase B-, and HSP90-like ATPase